MAAKYGIPKLSRKRLSIPTIAAALLFSFALALVSGSLFLQSQGTKAITGLGLVGNPTISLSTESSAINLNITPTSSGTLTSASHSLAVTTNVPTGYSLVLSTPDTPALMTASGGIANPAALVNNTWGYALATTDAVGVANDFDSGYAVPVPNADSKWADPSVGSTIKSTAASATNDTTNIYFGSKIDATLPSGTYTNTVRYTGIANTSTLIAPSIVSAVTASRPASGVVAVQIEGTGFTVNDQSVTTSVTVGGMACANVEISSNTPSTGKDTIFCNASGYAIGSVNAKGTVDIVVTTWGGISNTELIPAMQSIADTSCSAVRSIVQDARNGQRYYAQKLADGKCWMLSNLRYVGGGSNNYGDAKALSMTDSNYSFTNSYYFDPGGSADYTNTAAVGGFYGYLYNWCAAMGGQSAACSEDLENYYGDIGEYNIDANVSICPSGWRLPLGVGGGTDGDLSEFYTLGEKMDVNGNQYGSFDDFINTWLAVYSGEFGYSSAAGQGESGNYWTSSLSRSYYYSLGAKIFTVQNNNNLSPYDNSTYSWSTENAVRCVLGEVPPFLDADITAPTNEHAFDGGTSSINLSVATNANAICEYGKNNYDDYITMETTGGVSHSQSITGLTDASTNNYWVRCRASSNDVVHNVPRKRITFYIKEPLPSVPTLSPANGTTVRNGYTIVNVTSNQYVSTCKWGKSPENVVNASYSYANDTSYAHNTTTSGTNTLYYSCVRGYGKTASERTGSWSYTGFEPINAGIMQTVTAASCPTSIAYATDARNGQTYYIQKLADGKCWMLSNLKYAGGGNNTYGDTRGVTQRTSGNITYTTPEYIDAKGSSDYTNTPGAYYDHSFYGYLYNWCAAMGGQSAACTEGAINPSGQNTTISICPKGWRLPTGGTTSEAGGEFAALNNAVNGGRTDTSIDLTLTWLNGLAGRTTTANALYEQGYVLWDGRYDGVGHYWSSSVRTDTQYVGRVSYFRPFGDGGVGYGSGYGGTAFSVRCVAN